LILKFIGNENSLGIVESVSTILSLLIVYLVGRYSSPAQRPQIVLAGVMAVFAGSIFFGLLYSFAGVIIFQICLILSKPLQEMAFRSTLMRSVDYASALENRDEYTYLFDNELVRMFGRLTGAGVFMLLYFKGSEEMALRVALILVSIVLANTIWLSKILNTGNDKESGSKASSTKLLTVQLMDK
jgi:YQGE family putative transporter